MVIRSDSEKGQGAITIAVLASEVQSNARGRAIVKHMKALDIQCYVCERTFKATEFDASTSLCLDRCYDEAGLENEHSDGYHTEPKDGCPTCKTGGS